MANLARSESSRREALAVVHAAVYVGSGLWPVLHLRSFEAVTGRKPEGWLVKTVGLLLASIGVVIFVGRRSREPSIPLLGVTSAASLAAIDVVYASKRRISPVYFIDAALQLALVAGWAFAKRSRVAPRTSKARVVPPRARPSASVE